MTNTARYSRCITRVLKHIEVHLDEDLSVDVLSAVANFSPHHFHRQFSAYTGFGVGQLVRLFRLRRASMQLVFNPGVKISDIAYDACFVNAESFSRAFKKETGQSPTSFRRQPNWAPWQFKAMLNIRQENTNMQVVIVDFPETLVAALEHRGPENLTYNTIQKFIEWRKANGLGPDAGNTYGVHYSDPAITLPEEYRLDICLSVTRAVARNAQGVVTKTIPAGRCARVRHIGSRDNIHPAEWLYRQWLPRSGEQLRDYPIFFHYINVGPDVKEHKMITDVYLPLK